MTWPSRKGLFLTVRVGLLPAATRCRRQRPGHSGPSRGPGQQAVARPGFEERRCVSCRGRWDLRGQIQPG
ncbi:unnamed protein product [Caretta caretta]